MSKDGNKETDEEGMQMSKRKVTVAWTRASLVEVVRSGLILDISEVEPHGLAGWIG